jgi:hypothetical protein
VVRKSKEKNSFENMQKGNFPYPNLNICNSEDLLTVEERFICDKCNSSRKFFCYTCSLAHPNFNNEIPKVNVSL